MNSQCVLNKKIPLNLKKQIDLISCKSVNKNKIGQQRCKEIIGLLNLFEKILEKLKKNFKHDIQKVFRQSFLSSILNIILELTHQFKNFEKGIHFLLILESLVFQFTFSSDIILDQIYRIFLSIYGKNHYLSKLYYKKLEKHYQIYYGSTFLFKKIFN